MLRYSTLRYVTLRYVTLNLKLLLCLIKQQTHTKGMQVL